MPEIDTLGGEFECSYGSEFNQANIVKVFHFCAFLTSWYISSSISTTYIMLFDIMERRASFDQMRVLPVRHQHKPLCIIT